MNGAVKLATGAGLILVASVVSTQADWPNEDYETKHVQLPDLTLKAMAVRVVPDLLMADDFLCIRTGPITDIHLWMSWMNDIVDPQVSFRLSIWSDVPACAGPKRFANPQSSRTVATDGRL
jgi:hypothetical protein